MVGHFVEADIGQDLGPGLLVPIGPVAVLGVAGEQHVLAGEGEQGHDAGVIQHLVERKRHGGGGKLGGGGDQAGEFGVQPQPVGQQVRFLKVPTGERVHGVAVRGRNRHAKIMIAARRVHLGDEALVLRRAQNSGRKPGQSGRRIHRIAGFQIAHRSLSEPRMQGLHSGRIGGGIVHGRGGHGIPGSRQARLEQAHKRLFFPPPLAGGGVVGVFGPGHPHFPDLEFLELIRKRAIPRNVILMGMGRDRDRQFLARHLLDVFERLLNQVLAAGLDVAFVVNPAIHQDVMGPGEGHQKTIAEANAVHPNSNGRRFAGAIRGRGRICLFHRH